MTAFELAGTIVTTTIGTLTLAGLAVRYILVPYLRENLEKPVRETHHSLTVNHHSSPNPTMLDRVDTLTGEVRSMRAEQVSHGERLDELRAEVRSLSGWRASHERVTDQTLARVERIEDELGG